MLFFLIVSVVLVSIFLLKLLAAKGDQEYSQLLMEDDCFEFYVKLVIVGCPQKRKFLLGKVLQGMQ